MEQRFSFSWGEITSDSLFPLFQADDGIHDHAIPDKYSVTKPTPSLYSCDLKHHITSGELM
jgi:hypothetical protein